MALGLLVHYDSTTKIGMLLIGTGIVLDLPQRFVPSILCILNNPYKTLQYIARRLLSSLQTLN